MNDEKELAEAICLSDILLSVEDLSVELNSDYKFKYPQFEKAFLVIKRLRSYYNELINSDRDPYQLFTGLMRYAMHNIFFDESSELQKKWAFYSGSICSGKIKKSILQKEKLRIDFITLPENSNDMLGLTILPGRMDRKRNLREDIIQINKSGINSIVVLVTNDELVQYGVENLIEEYSSYDLEVLHFPILDQDVPSYKLIDGLMKWIGDRIKQNNKILLHCVGGLGRSGLVAAAFLISEYSIPFDQAIEILRENRSPRAVESKKQLEFLQNYRNRI